MLEGYDEEVAVTDAQGWTLLALVGMLLSVIGGLIVNQFHLLRGYLDARFEAVDARFGAVDQRLEHLDRDVQALARAVFRKE
ncbi:MAG: hypothetical protein H0U35_10750 [Sporichthyaceae bacterium]|nr:hypothetical protein [Sporichthyaceae bacterium]